MLLVKHQEADGWACADLTAHRQVLGARLCSDLLFRIPRRQTLSPSPFPRDPNTIFRGNSLASKCIDETMKLAGMHYLHVTLKPAIEEVSTGLESSASRDTGRTSPDRALHRDPARPRAGLERPLLQPCCRDADSFALIERRFPVYSRTFQILPNQNYT